MIDINMFKADHGDAFLLSFSNGQNILIDMGTSKTYREEIKPKILELKSKNQKIDLLIITHIDDDHIGGAIEFIQDNKEHKIIKVNEVWHNSYKHLQFKKEKVNNINEESKKVLKTIIQQNKSIFRTNVVQTISCKQGSSFSSLLYEYNYNWNTSFNNKIINSNPLTKTNIGEISFSILSPNKDKLEKLSNVWLAELKKKKYDFQISDEKIFDDAFEFYTRYRKENMSTVSKISKKSLDFGTSAQVEEKDNSVTNGSSLAFILEYKKKKLLFLGDAHEDIICQKLEELKNNGIDLVFDLVKVSHHGSNKNISNKLLNLIEAKKFLISTNGGKSNHHPDIEALSKIIISKNEYFKELIFNYKLDVLDKINNEELKNKYNFIIENSNKVLINE